MATTDLIFQLAKTIQAFTPNDGAQLSPVPGVHCIKFSRADSRTKRRWRACLGIVAQGSKEIVLGGTLYRFGEGAFTATPIELPVSSRIAAATPPKPFLALLIELDPQILSEVAAQLVDEKASGKKHRHRALFIGTASEEILSAAVRLTDLFRRPADARVLGPLVVREVIYHLLTSPEGPALLQFVRSGSKTHQVYQAIYTLRSSLDAEIDVSALARTANMSRSAFFQHFKAVTSVSPIQYQKRLRLLEARRLMIETGETAERAAFHVGYSSASQFSREYSRMFGQAPRRHADRFISEQRVLVS